MKRDRFYIYNFLVTRWFPNLAKEVYEITYLGKNYMVRSHERHENCVLFLGKTKTTEKTCIKCLEPFSRNDITVDNYFGDSDPQGFFQHIECFPIEEVDRPNER
ncbi:MAG: hypothetical protein AABY22_14125 [Nanoarchaeota archaeon]